MRDRTRSGASLSRDDCRTRPCTDKMRRMRAPAKAGLGAHIQYGMTSNRGHLLSWHCVAAREQITRTPAERHAPGPSNVKKPACDATRRVFCFPENADQRN